MTPADTDYDARLVHKGALHVANCITRHGGLRRYVEDIAQEVAMQVWEAHRKGLRVNRSMYWVFANHALRQLFGYRAGRVGETYLRMHCEYDQLTTECGEPSGERTNDLAPLMLRRLERKWPTLTPMEQGALFDFVADDQPRFCRRILMDALAKIDSLRSGKPPVRKTSIPRSRYVGIFRNPKCPVRPYGVKYHGRWIGRFATIDEAIHARDMVAMGVA